MQKNLDIGRKVSCRMTHSLQRRLIISIDRAERGPEWDSGIFFMTCLSSTFRHGVSGPLILAGNFDIDKEGSSSIVNPEKKERYLKISGPHPQSASGSKCTMEYLNLPSINIADIPPMTPSFIATTATKVSKRSRFMRKIDKLKDIIVSKISA
ncbi:hypothetical protein BDN70DRAFT_919015 [Pholiota conissans]|uniref:Uncharacterized protein n=1 Tax=Pholiota conissans TaxID=109636 RepID=A0A9P5Z7G2_9AGAR|nr:hypothetical protein BDN70DRAFT_919015 [Pholiota conissans]